MPPKVRFSRLASPPVRRGALAAILAGVVVFPGAVGGGGAAGPCRAARCAAQEMVRWSVPLAGLGSWVAEDGVEGTVPSSGQAYAAIGNGVAVIGAGQTISAYDEATGAAIWARTLTGLPVGAAIVSVRVWPGVVSVGISGVAASGTGLRGQPLLSAGSRADLVLRSATGARLGVFRSAASGGVISASLRRTVVIGPAAVTSYATITGKAKWRDPIGRTEQAWRVASGQLYITVSAQGQLGTSPVTAVRQITLRSGEERLIQPPSDRFVGTLTGAYDGVLVFTGGRGLSLYSAATGVLTGRKPRAVYAGIDPVQRVMYVSVAGALVGIDPMTGQKEPGMTVPGPAGAYGVRNGVALGLDAGASGEAWGYSVTKRHVVWTTRALPWPHYFVDLSGLGGSADPATGTVLLVTCAKTAGAVSGSGLVGVSGLVCLSPKLVAMGPR